MGGVLEFLGGLMTIASGLAQLAGGGGGRPERLERPRVESLPLRPFQEQQKEIALAEAQRRADFLRQQEQEFQTAKADPFYGTVSPEIRETTLEDLRRRAREIAAGRSIQRGGTSAALETDAVRQYLQFLAGQAADRRERLRKEIMTSQGPESALSALPQPTDIGFEGLYGPPRPTLAQRLEGGGRAFTAAGQLELPTFLRPRSSSGFAQFFDEDLDNYPYGRSYPRYGG